MRFEEDPDHEPETPEPASDTRRPAGLLPSVELPSREWEYRTENLTVAQVADGATLVKVLKEGAADGWELDQVVEAGEKRVLLLRRQKRQSRESRRVGFAPPSAN